MNISVLVLAKNEEEMIEECLSKLNFADEIIILDQGSKDNTVKIAAKFTDKIFHSSTEDFAKNRNSLAKMAKGEWLLYVDVDERFPQETISELKLITNSSDKIASVFYFPRKNYILGKWVKHGGWWPDYSPRLFQKDDLIKWEGSVHESPKVKGESSYLKNPIIHQSARNMSQMFAKTIKWAEIEAKLYNQTNYPNVTILKIIKAAIREFLRRYIFKIGFLDGSVGLIEGIYQAIHLVIVYTYLWEIQQRTKSKSYEEGL